MVQKISVLYVDDEPGLLEIGKIFLEKSGQFSVDIVTSAPDALAILATKTYDAILSDYQMPEMDGIEFLKSVRASGNTIPFLILTGRGREEIVIQALNEGANYYIQKGGKLVPQFTEIAHQIRTQSRKDGLNLTSAISNVGNLISLTLCRNQRLQSIYPGRLHPGIVLSRILPVFRQRKYSGKGIMNTRSLFLKNGCRSLSILSSGQT